MAIETEKRMMSSSPIDQILAKSLRGPLSKEEHARLSASFNALRSQAPTPTRTEASLIQEITHLREELARCRELIRKYDINENMD